MPKQYFMYDDKAYRLHPTFPDGPRSSLVTHTITLTTENPSTNERMIETITHYINTDPEHHAEAIDSFIAWVLKTHIYGDLRLVSITGATDAELADQDFLKGAITGDMTLYFEKQEGTD